MEGAPLELCCLVDSDPMAAVTWYKNDLIFMDDARDDVAEIAKAMELPDIEPTFQALWRFQIVDISSAYGPSGPWMLL